MPVVRCTVLVTVRAQTIRWLPLGLVALAASSCGSPTPTARTATNPSSTARDTSPPGARLFHGLFGQAFWVDHDDDRDLLVIEGARYESDAAGRILAVAVDETIHLRGGLLVREDLGGGFVFWSNEAIYRAESFTGPLRRFATPTGDEVLGVRNGLDGVVAFFASGHARLDLRHRELVADSTAGLADIVALDAERAVMLDILGQGWITRDGGVTRSALAVPGHVSIRAIGSMQDAVWIDAWHDYFELTGDLAAPPESSAAHYQQAEPFEIYFRGTAADDWRSRQWQPYETSLIQAAVLGGVVRGDGSALAVSPRMQARIDLRSGEAHHLQNDSLHDGLLCQPLTIPGATLFACRWQQYQYYGAYVFRSEGGAPPVLERAFSDDGGFVGTLDGAIAFVGSCAYRERLAPDGSFGVQINAPPEPASLCVRDRAGDWVEWTLPETLTPMLERWIPKLDGSAVALVRAFDSGLDGLPPPGDAGGAVRVVDGVTVIAVGGLGEGASLATFPFDDGSRSRFQQIDQSFSVAADGVVRGWAGVADQMVTGVEIDGEGRASRFALPKGAMASIGTGAYGLATTEKGDLFETTDGGRDWRPAGRSPVARRDFSGGCTALGCAVGAIARVGWGPSDAQIAISDGALEATRPPPGSERRAPRPRLSCAANGPPEPVDPAERSGHQQNHGTGYGDVFSIERLAVEGGLPSNPDPGETETAVVDTHELTFWPPFALRPKPRVWKGILDQVASDRAATTPLLTSRGEVALLVPSGKSEHIIGADGLQTIPAFESERYDWRTTSLPNSGLLVDGRALVVGTIRQRSTLEAHGAGEQRMPLYFGLDARSMPTRTFAVGRSDRGDVGLIALGGPTPDPAGVAPVLEGVALGLMTRLAPWSGARSASDEACRADGGYRALLVIEPASWFDLVAPPGVELGYRGLVQVKWSAELACIERVHLAAEDVRTGGKETKLVATFTGKDAGSGALRSDALWQSISCAIGAERGAEP